MAEKRQRHVHGSALTQGGVFEHITAVSGCNSVVECQLPKLDVAGSTPVTRSIFWHVTPGTPRREDFADAMIRDSTIAVATFGRLRITL